MSAFAREHLHRPVRDLVGIAMAIPVAILATLAVIGGWIQFAPFWEPISEFIDPVAEPLVHATGAEEAIAAVIGVAAGLTGIAIAWAIYYKHSVRIPAARPWRALLEHKFYFDELYNLVFYRPSVALARGLGIAVERPITGSVDEVGVDTRELGGLVAGLQTGFLRLYVLAIAARRVAPRPPVRDRAMNDWIATVLILLPVAGALLVWVLPFTNLGAGGFALLVALAEVGVWIQGAVRFDFEGGLQFEQQTSWFSDLNVSYHVGFYGFSLWLVGLTVVVMAAAIAYGLWSGRERARTYFGLMLVLTGAIVGVFAAQDLLVFYVFWETMMIPLYVLIGVWGGPGRLGATVKFVIYTLAGSLLMLASVIAFGLSQGTFDLVDSGTSGSTLVLLGFLAGFAVKAPLFPFHGWLPDAYRESSPEVAAVLSGVISKAATYGFLRIALPKFPDPVDELRWLILLLAATGLVYGSLLAFRAPDVRGVIAYSSLAQIGPDHARRVREQRPRARRLGAPDGQPRPAVGQSVPARRHGRAADDDRGPRPSRRHGARTPRAGDGADDDGDHRARRARLDRVRRRVPDPRGRLPGRLGLGGRRRDRDRARRHVHAADDLRGAAP